VLVLSRREREAIVVPDCRLEIVVMEILGDKVRIGIQAPDAVEIYRHEIWQQICFDQFTREKESEE
jgi:carbon storage regulator